MSKKSRRYFARLKKHLPALKRFANTKLSPTQHNQVNAEIKEIESLLRTRKTGIKESV